jgi:hypothetical protein
MSTREGMIILTPEQLWYGAGIVGLQIIGIYVLIWSFKIFGSARRVEREGRLFVEKRDEMGYAYKESEWPAGGYIFWALTLLAASIACFLASYTVYFEYLR